MCSTSVPTCGIAPRSIRLSAVTSSGLDDSTSYAPSPVSMAKPALKRLRPARLVSAVGGDVLNVCADVWDRAARDEAVRSGIERFGRLDVVLANAGIFAASGPQGASAQAWRDTIDVNLTGAYNTLEATIPS